MLTLPYISIIPIAVCLTDYSRNHISSRVACLSFIRQPPTTFTLSILTTLMAGRRAGEGVEVMDLMDLIGCHGAWQLATGTWHWLPRYSPIHCVAALFRVLQSPSLLLITFPGEYSSSIGYLLSTPPNPVFILLETLHIRRLQQLQHSHE